MAGNQRFDVNISQENTVRMSDGRLIQLLGIAGELNYVFNAKQFGLDKGIALLLHENISIGNFVANFQDECGAVRVNVPKRSCEKAVRNYQLAVCEYSKYQKWEELASFLDIKKFVPVVVVKGIVPDELRDMAYIIEISPEMDKSMKRPKFRAEVDTMIKFIRENPDVVVRELELLHTTEMFLKNDNNSLLLKNLLAAMCVYVAFYRTTHTDMETVAVKAEIEREIQECARRAEELTEEYDCTDAVKTAINLYFERNRNLEIYEVSEVNEQVLKAVKVGKAVLFDNDFYYISEGLFKSACSSLLTVLSFIQIKKNLRDEGFLVCNRIENTNFTVKKVFGDKKGQSFRERVIKLQKEFLVSRDGLYLEERRGDEVYR